MLSGTLRDHYQTFRETLHQLQAIATRANPDPATLQAQFLVAQHFFQQSIVTAPLDDIPAERVSLVQSYHTEVNKQLRLLGMDVMFLQAARQPTTTQQRQAQLRDRLETLQRYCQALIGDPPPEDLDHPDHPE